MDDKDRQILKLLKKDARMSFQQIGEELGISRVAAMKRVKKLELSGVIRGYNTAILDQSEITMLVDIVVKPEYFREILEYVSTRTAFVRQIFQTTKENHIHMVAVSDDLQDLKYLARMLRKKCRDKTELLECHAVKEIVKDVYLGIGRKNRNRWVLSMADLLELIAEKIDDPQFVNWAKQHDTEFHFPVYQGNPAMEADIDALDLSVRSYNCLKRAGYDTIDSVVVAISGRSDLMKLRNMGKTSADEVMIRLFLYTYEHLPEDRKAGYLKRVMEMNES